MSRYKAYSEYRDSGVDWFDSLPTKWDVKRISYIAQLQSGDAIVSEQIEAEGSYAVYGGNGLRGYSSNFNLEGDYILIGRQGALCGNINYGSGKFWASEHAVVVYPFFDVDIKWLGETLRAMNLNQYNVSAAQPGLAVTNITCLKIPFPSRDEQEKIAKFLDHETAKIDVLIEKQQRLIELLKEKRQAVISHAVTKGLNPNAPMKDSGVEWLGEVPAHWDLQPLKYLCSFSGGGTPSKDNLSYWSDGTIPWVSPKDMKSFWINDSQDKITQAAVQASSTNFVDAGSLLIVVRSGILQRTIPVAINTVPVTLNQDMKALSFISEMNVEFAANFILGNIPPLLLEWSKEGATVESIEHEYLSSSVFPVPPYHEQLEINATIRKRMESFDALEQQASTGISLLQERRTALISAAVTGKIDVRDWQAAAVQEAAGVEC
jgi:type I restriction enzyme, S subunit